MSAIETLIGVVIVSIVFFGIIGIVSILRYIMANTKKLRIGNHVFIRPLKNTDLSISNVTDCIKLTNSITSMSDMN